MHGMKSKTSSFFPNLAFEEVGDQRVYTKNKDEQEAKHKHTTYFSQAVP
jgi:hypothetical protein